jgi:hypothetical protein
MTDRELLLRWTFTNAIGMALGFLAFVQALMFLAFGLDFGLHWSSEVVESWAAENPENAERLLRIGLVVGLPLAGAIVASCQAWALRGRLSRLWQWILCGPAGFGVIILVIWPFTAIWGDIPGPVEPMTIVGGGLLATGGFEWLLLRRRGVRATRWLGLWILGLPLGMVVTAVVVIGTGEVFGYPPWALEVAISGFFVGGTAAAVSWKPLFRTVP